MYIIWAFEYSPVFKIKYRSTCPAILFLKQMIIAFFNVFWRNDKSA